MAILGPLHLHIKFRIYISISTNKRARNLIRNTLSLKKINKKFKKEKHVESLEEFGEELHLNILTVLKSSNP